MQCRNHGKLATFLKFGYFSYFKSMYNIYFAYCCILGTRILIQFCLCICVVQMPNSFKQRTRYLWLLDSVPYLLIWFGSVHLVSRNLSRHYNTKSYYWNWNLTNIFFLIFFVSNRSRFSLMEVFESLCAASLCVLALTYLNSACCRFLTNSIQKYYPFFMKIS